MTAPTHILVESIAHYEWARNSGRILGEAVWYSSSPAVVEKLQDLGEKVLWLDRFNKFGASDAAGEAALDVANWLAAAIRVSARELNWPRLELLVGMQVYRLLSTLIYKQATLRSWIDATPSERLIVGEAAIQFNPRMGLSIGVFDTVYAALWALSGGCDAELLEVPSVELSALTKDFDKPSPLTRTISLLDFSPAQLIYRIWKYVLRGRWPGFRTGPTVLLLNENNESIREMLPHFMRAGCEFKKLAIGCDVVPDEPALSLPVAPDIARAIKRSAKARGIDGSFGTIAEIVATRLRETSRYWPSWIALAKREMQRVTSSGKRFVILSSTLKGYADSAASVAAAEHRISTVIAQHGVSAGLSKYHIPSRGYSEAISGDVYLVSAKAAQQFSAVEAKKYGVQQVVIGVPNQVRRIQNRRAQRWLTRRSLSARERDRVVVYVAGTNQNNMIFQPYNLEDHEVHSLHRTMADSVMPNVRGVPVIKLYSTRRYRDSDPLAGEFAAPFPVRTIKFGDFRFLRAAADIIVLDSPLSTIGWVMGTGKPVFYLAHPSMPLLPDAQAAMQAALFYIDLSEPGWPERLVESLNRPDEAIAANWKVKAPARGSFLQHYAFGPENAGRNGAEAVIMAARAAVPSRQVDKQALAAE